MSRTWIILGLGALILLPTAATAQDPEVAFFTVGDRPRIGVMVDIGAPAANNAIGATVKSVTPDGPAAKAGLEAGDIISKFGGTSLAGDAPGQKLVELAGALSPGDTVKVEYRRGSANRTATIVAANLGGGALAWTSGPGGNRTIEIAPDMRDQVRIMRDQAFDMRDMERAMAGMGNQFTVRFDGGFGLELAEMNVGLGEYFGTSKGILVLENPSDSTMPIKAGDVILAIDGRAPSDVGQARRIFASYDSGDVAKFDIMRMKKKTTVSWTVPAQSHMKMPAGGMMWKSAPPPAGMPRGPEAPGSMPRTRIRMTAPAIPAGPAPSAPAPPAFPT